MAFIYKNFVFADLTSGVSADTNDQGEATDVTIDIDSTKTARFRDLVADGNEAVLIIKEDVTSGGTTTSKFEIVKLVSISGNQLTVERGHESTELQAFSTNARISNALTADRAKILGGIANTDLVPEGERAIGATATPFNEVHAKSLSVTHGSNEFVIKPQVDEAITANQDLFLPKEGGTLARLEDTTENHPGCFRGTLCVEPAAEDFAAAAAHGNADIGNGIQILAIDLESSQRTLKLIKYDDGVIAHNLQTLLGLELVPNDDEDADDVYRRTSFDIDGNNYSFLNVKLKTVGEYQTADGEIPSGMDVAVVQSWLSTITYERNPPGLLVAQKIYGDDLASEKVITDKVEAEEVEVSKNLRIPVLATTPGVDEDTTKDYAAGSVIYCTATKAPYVCISNTEEAAKWRPMVTLSPSDLTVLANRNYNDSGDREVDRTVPDLSGFKRLYTAYASEQWGTATTPTMITNQLVDYEEFKAGQDIVNGHTRIKYKSDTSVTFVKTWGGTASDWDESTTWLLGET